MPRVLCLHGSGSNATIFSSQTFAVRRLLPKDYEFIYVDGPFRCDPDPAITFPGPYYCWYNTPTSVKFAAAHRAVARIIEEKGPFDFVMGFSQGGAVAGSVIVHYALANPTAPPLFQGAIFLCSTIPFSIDIDHGLDVREYFGIPVDKPVRTGCPTEMPEHLVTDPYFLMQQGSIAKTVDGYSAKEAERIKASDVFFQIIHRSTDDVCLNIPTAHCFGKRDRWIGHSKDLADLCREDSRSVFEHGGGHEVPKNEAESIARTIQRMFEHVRRFEDA
ncbi:hypothetical protein LTS18_008407 [Coniosporium uncinatum]|uniref:Uncharacterized protein n=1 Tax=Coniosporium uncinatum TaxID=93489 RepID=A0ACC3D259_9PEZI|nr:hypothetical protein LTS18_008407 [Coniosporium uncinatum]